MTGNTETAEGSKSASREKSSPWDLATYQKLRAMPSSLNDAIRTMDEAAGEIDRLYAVLEELAVGFESARDRCTYASEAQRLDNCAKFCRRHTLPTVIGDTKTVYVKRWRTLVKLPAQYADEIVAALRIPAQPQAAQLREALEAVDSEVVLTGHLQELVDAALAATRPTTKEAS